jgi:hypothetical protein
MRDRLARMKKLDRESDLFSDTEFGRVKLNSELLAAGDNEAEAAAESPY